VPTNGQGLASATKILIASVSFLIGRRSQPPFPWRQDAATSSVIEDPNDVIRYFAAG